jgi:mono/diheme cytochrome c family protein
MKPCYHHFCCLALALLLAVTGSPAAETPASADFDKVLKPFLDEHCTRCHGEKKHKGELRLDTLSRDFVAGGSAMHWADVMDRISSAEMPPEDEPQPTTAEAAKIVEWLAARLKEGESARLARRERVTFHKLTREEYANTIYDLLGVHYDATDPTGLPEDPNWNGFERIGSVLSLSPAHVEKYFAAAEGALAEALPVKPPAKISLHWGAFDLRGSSKKDLTPEQIAKVRVDVWPGSTFYGQPGSVHALSLPVSGDYKLRVKLSGLKPLHGRAPHVVIYAADLDRVLLDQDVVAPEDQPVTLECLAHLPAGNHPIRMMNEAPGPSNLPRAGRNGSHPFFSIKDGREPWQTKLTDEAGQPILPFLIVDWVEWEGPMIDSSQTLAQQQYLPKGSRDIFEAREILKRFADRAFRRPARDAELDGFVNLVESEMQSGETYDAALKTGLLAILCSKDFFYLVEGSAEVNTNQINDWELASRLSYFLWSTTPDAPLSEAAATGALHRPEVLRAQVARMLRDPRIVRFTEAFSRQWLQLRRVGMFPPDKKLYPTYDDYLQKSMVAETTAYFREVLAENLSLREFLDSDWTMLNARLAEHYEIPNVTDDRFQRVSLRPEDHRGGLLTQAAVLSLTSDGARHRPVHRGKWVLESIIGKPPPPPPANVKPIEPTPETRPKATLRMKLAAHESDANCAACHRRIDPLGFAFDNYDAIGRWRTEEVVRDGNGENPRVDASGELIDGRKFSDAGGFKKLLLADIDKFNAAFVEKLATFALRRALSVDDRTALQSLAKQSKAADYRLPAIIEALVLSDLFQKR